MDKYLKPSRFDCDPNAVGADKQFKHWLQTFQNFVDTIKTPTTATTTGAATTGDAAPEVVDLETLKLRTLTNYIAANVYEFIGDCSTYTSAIETLEKIYVKPVNEIFARYKLATCQQSEGESLDTFIQNLHKLSKDCNFKAVSGEEHRQGHVRDAFISGIRSHEIRQKLLENTELSMEQIFSQARTLQTAHTNAAGYRVNENSFTATTHHNNHPEVSHEELKYDGDRTVAAVGCTVESH